MKNIDNVKENTGKTTGPNNAVRNARILLTMLALFLEARKHPPRKKDNPYGYSYQKLNKYCKLAGTQHLKARIDTLNQALREMLQPEDNQEVISCSVVKDGQRIAVPASETCNLEKYYRLSDTYEPDSFMQRLADAVMIKDKQLQQLEQEPTKDMISTARKENCYLLLRLLDFPFESFSDAVKKFPVLFEVLYPSVQAGKKQSHGCSVMAFKTETSEFKGAPFELGLTFNSELLRPEVRIAVKLPEQEAVLHGRTEADPVLYVNLCEIRGLQKTDEMLTITEGWHYAALNDMNLAAGETEWRIALLSLLCGEGCQISLQSAHVDLFSTGYPDVFMDPNEVRLQDFGWAAKNESEGLGNKALLSFNCINLFQFFNFLRFRNHLAVILTPPFIRKLYQCYIRADLATLPTTDEMSRLIVTNIPKYYWEWLSWFLDPDKDGEQQAQEFEDFLNSEYYGLHEDYQEAVRQAEKVKCAVGNLFTTQYFFLPEWFGILNDGALALLLISQAIVRREPVILKTGADNNDSKLKLFYPQGLEYDSQLGDTRIVGQQLWFESDKPQFLNFMPCQQLKAAEYCFSEILELYPYRSSDSVIFPDLSEAEPQLRFQTSPELLLKPEESEYEQQQKKNSECFAKLLHVREEFTLKVDTEELDTLLVPSFIEVHKSGYKGSHETLLECSSTEHDRVRQWLLGQGGKVMVLDKDFKDELLECAVRFYEAHEK